MRASPFLLTIAGPSAIRRLWTTWRSGSGRRRRWGQGRSLRGEVAPELRELRAGAGRMRTLAAVAGHAAAEQLLGPGDEGLERRERLAAAALHPGHRRQQHAREPALLAHRARCERLGGGVEQ